MVIPVATLDGVSRDMDFFRHNLELAVGRGPASLGVLYQITDKAKRTEAGTPERGLMLTAGYDHVLSERLRLEAFGRLGLTPGLDFGQPLYATDTDLRLNLVASDPDGLPGLAGRRLYPSGYVGGIVNRHGRVQGLAGAGLWWDRVGTYLTGFYAFNGVEDVAADAAGRAFANLRNGGVSLSLTYAVGPLAFGARQNFVLRNGGNDFTLSVRFRHVLGEDLW